MSKAEERANEKYPTWKNGIGDNFNTNSAYYGFIEGYQQAEKDMLSEYGWLVLKVKNIKLKYCHNREVVKAIEEACGLLSEFKML